MKHQIMLKIKHFSRSILKFKYMHVVKMKHFPNFQDFVQTMNVIFQDLRPLCQSWKVSLANMKSYILLRASFMIVHCMIGHPHQCPVSYSCRSADAPAGWIRRLTSLSYLLGKI